MWKKFLASSLMTIYLLALSANVFAEGGPVFDKSNLDSGIVKVDYDNQNNAKLKFMVQKQSETYYYDLSKGDSFPLQLGNGKYTVAVLENVTGKKYRVVEKDTLFLDLKNPNNVFLNSIKLINWNENMASIKKARELTKNAKTDMAKVAAIYDYITKNITYDDKKINSVGPEYVPDIDKIIAEGSGICYDYSSLFASMLRSINVPAKLVMGYKNDVDIYHAWNQVYLKEQNRWVTIDTTYDSTLRQDNERVSMIKDEGQYKAEKIY